MKKKFKIVIEKGENGYFIGEVPELPGCYSQGKTKKELMENIKEAIGLYIESMEELNKKPLKKFVQFKEVIVNA
ncbi:MAG TPA: type II toxin-antitoxin system HicB family antitoxin [archaeon]|nr:type II toxin-antitoxin system HicB family antitoxin [archaeon]